MISLADIGYLNQLNKEIYAKNALEPTITGRFSMALEKTLQ